jgi:TRAP-type mannitol/chloroaromatic compound transport system substrate-binding protein
MISGGQFIIDFAEPGAIVAAASEWDGVQEGTLDGYVGGIIDNKAAFGPVSSILCEHAAGPNPDAFTAWYLFGDGMKLAQELIDRTPGWDNVIIRQPVATWGAEDEMWTNKKIKEVGDYKGLKIRVYGDWGRILADLGASVVFIPAGEVYQALERGVIDACEVGDRAFNLSIALHEVAKYCYYPGVHAPSSNNHLVVNRDSWEALPDGLKQLLDMAVASTAYQNMAEGPLLNAEATEVFEKYGVEFVELPIQVQAQIAKKADELWESYAAKDEFFAKVYHNLKEFKVKYASVANVVQPNIPMLLNYGKECSHSLSQDTNFVVPQPVLLGHHERSNQTRSIDWLSEKICDCL